MMASVIVQMGEGQMFICGPGADHTWACSECGRMAYRLCDYPMGNGRTCDASLCDDDARSFTDIGADTDFCPVHAAMAGATYRRRTERE